MSDTTNLPAPVKGDTKRAYLVRLGLAKEGARGRFSKDATAALDAHPDFEWADPAPTPASPAKAEKAQRVVTTPAPAPAPSVPAQATANLNAKEVRAWAKVNGHKVGERGRIHPSVISAYVKANGAPVGPVAARPTPLLMPKRRKETTGFVFAPRPEGAGKHVTTPLVRVSSCGYCTKSVAYCGCPEGPRAPLYLGGAALTLDKPAG